MHPSQISLVTCELDGLIQHLEELSEAYSSVFIISDSRIESAYRSQFDRESPAWKWITLSEGEMAKSLREVVHAWQDLASAHADRGSLVIGLGGGAVCDVAGFVAATYMRGIDIIQVPTTLLAMVDASVGGKTAIDFAGEKNLIGAFKVPIGVFICPHFLDSLDERQFRAGLAEIIKHAVIAGEEHRLALEENMGAILAKDTAVLREVIELSVRVKGDVVERDPLEKGHRALLNYGHTFGHAIEVEAGYGELLHGEAVAIGMAQA
ncbi:MAG: 3-dehydroquinate synthase, partial [Chlamydiia bacterium]|nr:3-dehydroquinate synthase [Chlamydiia bacterium]